MKLMKKIKDILFDEEEVEIPVIEATKKKPKQKPKPIKENPIIDYEEEEKNSIKEIKMPDDDDLTDKDTLKSDMTFPFPIEFDDDELERTRPIETAPLPKRSETPRPTMERERDRDRERYRNYEVNSPVTKPREIKDYSSYLKDKEEKKQFKPTPIISPVYGVLDQNYKKEDLVVKSDIRKNIKTKGKPDLDSVRKKAYGEAVEEIPEEKVEVIDVLDDPVIDPKTPIGDLIEEEESIKLPKMGKIEEEPTIELNELIDKKEEIEKKLEDEIEDDDTDLFSLIDSMYEENNE